MLSPSGDPAKELQEQLILNIHDSENILKEEFKDSFIHHVNNLKTMYQAEFKYDKDNSSLRSS